MDANQSDMDGFIGNIKKSFPLTVSTSYEGEREAKGLFETLFAWMQIRVTWMGL